MDKKLKKIKIPIGVLFEKLNIKHSDKELEEEHNTKINIYVKTPKNEITKINKFITKRSDTYEYFLENGKSLKTSDKHIIIENKKEIKISKANSVDNIDGNSYKIIKSKKLKENEIVYDFNIDDPHLYVTPDGSINHNSKISTYATLYIICRILHLKNPQEKFKLPETTKIIFMLTNSTIEAADSINYDPMIAIMRESPFFVEHFNKKGRTLFIKNIDVSICSRKRQLVGKDVISAISDEVNQEVVKGGSFELVTEMINRINSRFILEGNKWPGKYFIISSAQTENSLTEKIKNNFEGFSGIEMVNPARFEVLKHKIKYSGEKFKVFIGTYDSDPFIIENDEQLETAFNIDPSKIYEVPVEHYQEFKNSIDAGIQDVLGKPTLNSKTFLKDKQAIRKALKLTKLYDKDYILVDDDETNKIIDMFDKDLLRAFDPKKPRVIAIDIGLSQDRFGFAMLHRRSEVKVERYLNNNLGTAEDFVYWADLCLAFIPEEIGKKLKLEKIRDFIRDLRDFGFNIQLIVSDGYQSEYFLQKLESDGFKTKLNSVDRKKQPYYTLKYALEEGRLKLPNNKILLEELNSLYEDDKKIDHIMDLLSSVPLLRKRELNISKDLSDSVANAIYMFDKEIKPSKLENENYVKNLKSNAGLETGDKIMDMVMKNGIEVDYL